ncbi:MAG: sigma-70 family RNA polymerase sigma factor [Verrucomicrobiaceae bacterium]|jgi:DNA-directed RNA polymerase specialized sigma24 family protein|nr:sigma-70 family RNA polymerase sigma factor [Verrucomicrobiaceae bacterium]
MAALPPKGDGRFPTTEWTLVERLKNEDPAVSTPALNDLCAQYHYPLYCLIRARGLAHHDAEDALHDFLAKLLRLEIFNDLGAEKGRLRTFLAKTLERSLISRYHRESRRGRQEVPAEHLRLPIAPDIADRYASESTDSLPPDKLFDRKWCEQLLGRVLRSLAENYATLGKRRLFEALRPVLLAGGSLRGHDTAALAGTLGMTEPALRTALVRLLRDYRRLLEHEVRQTVDSKQAVDAEIADLMAALGNDG